MKHAPILFCLLVSSAPAIFAADLPPHASFLRELVSISSGTASINGVNEVQEKVAVRLKALGFNVEMKPNPQSGIISGKQLSATLKGQDPRYITLVGHADTVFEKLNPFEVSADGKIALGSGVSDNKGGLVVGLGALENYLNTIPKGHLPHYSIRFVSSPSEEIGSGGWTDSLRSYAEDSVMILGLEPAREDGGVVMSRKGARWVFIKVIGKEAHAGVGHEIGVNACQELAIKINQIQKLTDYKNGTTVSIGHIEGGKDKFNIICGEASAKIDTRFTDKEKGEALLEKIKTILNQVNVRSFKDKTPTQTTFEIATSNPPFHFSKKTLPLLHRYLTIVKEIEKREVTAESTGGAGDVNFMDINNVPIIDGLGPIGGGYHTNSEFVQLESLDTRALILSNFMQYIEKTIH